MSFAYNPFIGNLDYKAEGGSSGGTPLLAANNLSDLTNTTTARTNLGVTIGSQVQAYDADLQAIAAIAATSGFLVKTNANLWTLRTFTVGTGLNIVNGNGAAGNPVLRVTGGGLSWVEAILFNQPMNVNTGYFALVNAGTFTLASSSAALGDTIRIVGTGAFAWKINQITGQSIRIGSQVTTVGVTGSVTSTSANDCIEMTYANNGLWVATSYTGTFTVV